MKFKVNDLIKILPINEETIIKLHRQSCHTITFPDKLMEGIYQIIEITDDKIFLDECPWRISKHRFIDKIQLKEQHFKSVLEYKQSYRSVCFAPYILVFKNGCWRTIL